MNKEFIDYKLRRYSFTKFWSCKALVTIFFSNSVLSDAMIIFSKCYAVKILFWNIIVKFAIERSIKCMHIFGELLYLLESYVRSNKSHEQLPKIELFYVPIVLCIALWKNAALQLPFIHLQQKRIIVQLEWFELFFLQKSTRFMLFML